MGWREAIEKPMEWELPQDIRQRLAIEMHAGLLTMPTPDRIALARELLAGTGRVVARDVGEKLVPQWRQDACLADGWNACRAAMLKEDGE